MRRLLLIFSIFVIAIAFFIRNPLHELYRHLFDTLPNVEKSLEELPIPKITVTVNVPSPLRAKTEDEDAFLTVEGVIKITNDMRVNKGLPPLTQNNLLNESAHKKAQDMFNKQYFAHDAPDGTKASNIIDGVGYSFIAVGENLALGNFKDDAVLVQAWINSPGHKENIVNSKYTEIGVGVSNGVYEGKKTWIAVQHFALPESACPRADESLRNKLEQNEAYLEKEGAALDALRAELEAEEERRDEEYRKKVGEFNARVNAYNESVSETKKLAEMYNSQVRAFNACAGVE